MPNNVVDQLSSLSASVVADATGGVGVLAPGLLRLSGRGVVVGRAVTAECGDGSLMAVFAALERAGPGDFLFMTAPGTTAYMGDLLATDLVGRGITGAVVDGYVRDIAVIKELPLSVFARGVTPAARRKQEPGRAMVELTIGDVTIAPGDWVVADDDGVVVIPPANVEVVIANAAENARLEEKIMERVRSGTKIVDAVRQVLSGEA